MKTKESEGHSNDKNDKNDKENIFFNSLSPIQSKSRRSAMVHEDVSGFSLIFDIETHELKKTQK